MGIITLLSRFLGLARDMVLTACFGVTWVADVFLLAFEIPNLARRVLGEGSLSAFIVPIFSKVRAEEGNERAWRFASNALTVLGLLTLGMTVLGILFAKPIFSIFGYGYFERGDVEALEMGVHLTRIMFPFLMILALSSLLMGLCHSIRHFVTPSLGSVMLNISMIFAGLVFARWPKEQFAQWLAVSVLAGGGLRFLIMLPPLAGAGFHYRPVFHPRSSAMRQLFVMMIPALFGLAVAQINITASRAFATKIGEGLVICLVVSNRLVQLPLAIIAASLSTAILPQLSQFRIEKRTEDLCGLVRYAFSLVFILFVPATVGLCVLGLPVIDLVFNRGRWDMQASSLTYDALVFYAPGLVMWGMLRILTPIYYADHDVRTPVLAGAVSMLFNLLLNVLLISIDPLRTTLGHGGLALANTMGVFVNGFLLLWILKRRGLRLWDRRLSVTFLQTVIASAVMGLGGWFFWALVGPAALAVGRAAALAALGGAVLLSLALYFGTAYLLHVRDLREGMKMLLPRRRSRNAG